MALEIPSSIGRLSILNDRSPWLSHVIPGTPNADKVLRQAGILSARIGAKELGQPTLHIFPERDSTNWKNWNPSE